jgi:lipopolysaccharide transport system ATP-binding protein
VDEVLAVGDAEFQKKCLGKMDDVSRREGRTVLFVSHNMGVITSLCPTAIWLDQGSIRQQGSARAVITEYLAHGMPNKDRMVRLDRYREADRSDEDRLRLESLEWLCNLPLQHGEPLKAQIRFRTRAPITDLSVGIGFSSLDGNRYLTYETDFQDGFRPCLSEPGIYAVNVEVESLPLAPDVYVLDIGCRSGDFHSLAHIPAGVELEIIAGPNTPGTIVRKGAGVRLASKWVWNECRSET